MGNEECLERTEQDSDQLSGRVKGLSNESIISAIQEVTLESDRLVEKLKEEAAEYLRDFREKASAEVRQESARIINEASEKTAQIINEVTRRSLTQAKSEMDRFASEARSRFEDEKSKLLAITKNIEQILNETEANIQASIKNVTSVVIEIEEKLQTVSSEGETVTGPRRITQEVMQPQPAARLNKPEIEKGSLEKEKGTEESQDVQQRAKKEAENVMLDLKIQMRKGEALLESGKNEEALEVFTKVIKLDPENTIAWRKKGVILSKLGRNKEALAAFEKVTELDPKDISAWHSKATALSNLRKTKEADEAP